MSFLQVEDILNRAVGFHELLVDFYSRIENVSDKENVKLLADYMARHKKVLKENLSQITAEQQQHIKNAWVKYEPEYDIYSCLENLKIDKDSGVDDIIDAGLQLNQCLINLYHQIAEVVQVQEIKTLFLKLELMEIAEKKKLARIRGM